MQMQVTSGHTRQLNDYQRFMKYIVRNNNQDSEQTRQRIKQNHYDEYFLGKSPNSYSMRLNDRAEMCLNDNNLGSKEDQRRKLMQEKIRVREEEERKQVMMTKAKIEQKARLAANKNGNRFKLLPKAQESTEKTAIQTTTELGGTTVQGTLVDGSAELPKQIKLPGFSRRSTLKKSDKDDVSPRKDQSPLNTKIV